MSLHGESSLGKRVMLVACWVVFLCVQLCQFGLGVYQQQPQTSYSTIRDYPSSLTYQQRPRRLEAYNNPPPPPEISEAYINELVKKALKAEIDKINYNINKLKKCCSDAKANVTRLEGEIAEILSENQDLCPKYFILYRIAYNDLTKEFSVVVMDSEGFTPDASSLTFRVPATPAIRGLFSVEASMMLSAFFLGNFTLLPSGPQIAPQQGSSTTSFFQGVQAGPSTLHTEHMVRTVSRARTSTNRQRYIISTQEQGSNGASGNRKRRETTDMSTLVSGLSGQPVLLSFGSIRLNTATHAFDFTPDPVLNQFLNQSSFVGTQFVHPFQLTVRISLYDCIKE